MTKLWRLIRQSMKGMKQRLGQFKQRQSIEGGHEQYLSALPSIDEAPATGRLGKLGVMADAGTISGPTARRAG